MDTLITSTSNPSISFLSPSLSKQSSGFSLNFNSCFIIRNGHSSFVPISSNNLLGTSRKRSLMVKAKKGDEKKNNKVDSHSFAPKSDEATGPFPEAILLKQKKVQEDGRLLPDFADEDEEEFFEFLNLELESDLDADQMRHYEVVYMIHQDHKDKVEDVNKKIQDFIREKEGRVWRFSDWGMRRLAYKIQKTTHAHYILMNFELGAQWMNEFKQILDQDERVIRHLVIKRKNAITENCPPPPEFHTLGADTVDEYEVDDMEEDDEEEYDADEDENEDEDDEEGYDADADADAEDENENENEDEIDVEENSNTKREKVLR